MIKFLFTQAKVRNEYSLKFLSTILFAVTFLVGSFFVANNIFAVAGEGTATINGGANVTVTKSTSYLFTVVLTVGASGITVDAANPTFTIPTGFTAPKASPVANAGLVLADGDWSAVGGATCPVTMGSSSASGQTMTVDVTTVCTVEPTEGKITLTYKGTSNTVIGATAFTIGTADSLGNSPVVPISNPPTITVTETISNCTSVCYVDAVSGNDTNNGMTTSTSKKTIQSAITQVSVGGTINVAAGIYTEQLVINKNIIITGAGSSTTIIQAPAVLINDADGAKDIVLVTGSVTAEISGFTIQGPVNGLDFGIYVRGGATTNIHDNIIKDVRDETLSGRQSGEAIQVGRWPGYEGINQIGTATITNNTIYGYQKVGIAVENTGSSATITGNIVTGVGPTTVTAQNGIQLRRGATGTIASNTVTGNAWDGPTWSAFGIGVTYAGSGVIIQNNIVNHNSANIYAYGDDGIQILNNQVSDSASVDQNKAAGITVQADNAATNLVGLTGVLISGNTVQNNLSGTSTQSDGIDIYGVKSGTVSNNTITGSSYDGILVGGSGNITFTGNTFSNNGLLVSDSNAAAIDFRGIPSRDWSLPLGNGGANTLGGFIIHNNSFRGNRNGIWNYDTASVYAVNNWWGGSLTGPTVASNPLGTGDAVSTNVTFIPWYTNAEMTTTNIVPFNFVEYAGNPIWGGSTAANKAYSPYVIKINGVYNMWYGDGANARYTSSTYPDFHDVTFPGTIVTGTTATQPYKFTVYYNLNGWTLGGTFYSQKLVAYYTDAVDGFTKNPKIAVSDNGIDWTFVASTTGINEYPSAGSFYRLSVLYEGGNTWKGYGDQGQAIIQYYTSTNGIDWTGVVSDILKINNPQSWESSSGAISPYVFKAGGIYIMTYSAGLTNNNQAIGIAYSSDGINWAKSSTNPVFSIDDNVIWRTSRTYNSYIMFDDGLWRMYFQGNSAAGAYSVGMATSVTGVVSFTAYNTALAAVTSTDYTSASWTTYQSVVTANVVTIANSQTEINTATLNITTAQSSLVTVAAETLAAAKTTAHNALTAALGTYTQSNYSGANWITLNGFKTTGDSAITAARSLGDVTTAQNTATTAMAGVIKLTTTQTTSGLSGNSLPPIITPTKTIITTEPSAIAIITPTKTIITTEPSAIAIITPTKTIITTENPLAVIVKNIVPIVVNVLTGNPPLSGIVSKPIVVTIAPENPPLFDVISQPVPPTAQNRTPFIIIAIVAWILIASLVLFIVRRITRYLLIMKVKKDMRNAKIKKNETIH